jgi:hypothetical protein
LRQRQKWWEEGQRNFQSSWTLCQFLTFNIRIRFLLCAIKVNQRRWRPTLQSISHQLNMILTCLSGAGTLRAS